MGKQGSYVNVKAIRRSRQELRKTSIICVLTVLIIFAACAVFGNVLSTAHGSSPDSFKYYTSVEIQPGDTLWDIAAAYITEDYNTVPEYVKALKKLNSLDTDDIQAGQRLMVAYNNIKP